MGRKVVRAVNGGALLLAFALVGCGQRSLGRPPLDAGSDGPPPDAGSDELPPADGGSDETTPPLPPVALTVGAMVSMRSAGSDWTRAVHLAVADVNTALAAVNAAQKGAWR